MATIKKQAASFDTLDIILRLAKADFKVPETIANPKAKVAQIALIDAEIAKIRDQEASQPSRLAKTCTEIQTGITLLGQTKATLPLQEAFNRAMQTIHTEIDERLKQVAQLPSTIQDHVTRQRGWFRDLIKAATKGGKAAEQLDATLQAIEQKQQVFLTEVKAEQAKQNALIQKLDALHSELYQSIPGSNRANLTPPSTLQEPSKQTPGN